MAYWTFRFQSRVVPSSLPLASVCPSGLNATESTAVVPPVRGWPSGPGCAGSADIPQPDGAVDAAAGQRVPIGAERHRIDVGCAAGQGLAERPGVRGIGDIPQPDEAVELPLASVCPSGLNATE